MFYIELTPQFFPENVGRTRAFIFEQTARNIICAICSRIKTRVYLGEIAKCASWQLSFLIFS